MFKFHFRENIYLWLEDTTQRTHNTSCRLDCCVMMAKLWLLLLHIITHLSVTSSQHPPTHFLHPAIIIISAREMALLWCCKSVKLVHSGWWWLHSWINASIEGHQWCEAGGGTTRPLCWAGGGSLPGCYSSLSLSQSPSLLSEPESEAAAHYQSVSAWSTDQCLHHHHCPGHQSCLDWLSSWQHC